MYQKAEWTSPKAHNLTLLKPFVHHWRFRSQVCRACQQAFQASPSCLAGSVWLDCRAKWAFPCSLPRSASRSFSETGGRFSSNCKWGWPRGHQRAPLRDQRSWTQLLLLCWSEGHQSQVMTLLEAPGRQDRVCREGSGQEIPSPPRTQCHGSQQGESPEASRRFSLWSCRTPPDSQSCLERGFPLCHLRVWWWRRRHLSHHTVRWYLRASHSILHRHYHTWALQSCSLAPVKFQWGSLSARRRYL